MKNQIIIPPKDGWKKQSYYVVEIAMSAGNPIHMDIFYSGFVVDNKPAGYNNIMSAGVEIKDVKYIKVICEIDKTIDNPNKMLNEAVPEYLLVEEHNEG
jgi:hypothetical protein